MVSAIEAATDPHQLLVLDLDETLIHASEMMSCCCWRKSVLPANALFSPPPAA